MSSSLPQSSKLLKKQQRLSLLMVDSSDEDLPDIDEVLGMSRNDHISQSRAPQMRKRRLVESDDDDE